MEKKRTKRTHAEVVASREVYAKELHDKKVAKEARKAEREKLLEERAKRRAEREARKEMSPEELRAARYEARKEKLTKKKGIQDGGPKWEPYKGKIEVGDKVKAIFAGSPVCGVVESIVSEEDREFEFRKGVAGVTLYEIITYEVNSLGKRIKWTYPVRREKIVEKY